MLKSLTSGKIRAGVLFTLMALIVLGACYFFIYIPNNEEAMQQQRFRCLQTIEAGINKKIENSENQIAILVNSYDLASDFSNNKKSNNKKEDIKKFIKGYSKDNFTLLLPERADEFFKGVNKPIYLGKDTSGTIKFFLDIGSEFTFIATKTHPKNDKHKSEKSNSKDVSIGIQYGFRQFVKPLLFGGIFDHYIVFVKQKKIYDDFRSGLSLQNPDSLLNITSKITTPGIRSLKIGGTEYKLFSQPVYSFNDNSNDNKWIITGLLDNSNYKKEKSQLPTWVLLLLFTTAITMLVFLPWIKLFNMGNKDRVSTRDMISSLLVAMILMSLLFFIFFKYRIDLKTAQLAYSGDTTGNTTDTYALDLLATKITAAFVREKDDAYKLLSLYDSVHKNSDPDVSNLAAAKGKDSSFHKNNSNGIDVKQIFWLDSNGNEKTNLTVSLHNDPKSNYGKRDYFKDKDKFINKWNQSYCLTQLISLTEGTFRSIISKKSKDSSVAVMAFNMKSLDNVVIPDGYKFAIITSAGWVMYHQNPDRNLFENLKNEFSNNAELTSALEAKSESDFDTKYYGKLYHIRIKPIPDLPLYTVIFESRDFNDTRDTEAYVFTISMLICMVTCLCINYSGVFFASSGRSFFKKQHFDTSWIAPHMSLHHEYNVAVIINIFIISMLLIYFNSSCFLEYLYILLVSIIFASLFLSGIYARKYKNTDPYKFNFKITGVYWLSGVLILINISSFFKLTGENIFHLILYELILIGFYLLVLFFSKPLFLVLNGLKVKKNLNWNFTSSYAMMSTTHLIIASGISSAFFFISAYNYEQKLDIRYRQLNFASKLVKQYELKGKKDSAIAKIISNIKENSGNIRGVYYDGRLINNLELSLNKRIEDSLKRACFYTKDDLLGITILSAFRLHINAIEIANENMNALSIGDNIFFNKLNEKSGEGSPVQTFYRIDKDRYLKISSLPKMNYTTPGPLFWALLILALLVFYNIIHRVIRKLFSMNLYNTEGWRQLDNDLLMNSDFNKLLFIIGAPGADTLSKLKYKITKGKIKGARDNRLEFSAVASLNNSAFIADMINISSENGPTDKKWENHKQSILNGHDLVIINHFEYDVKDAVANKIKLDLLETLLEQATGKIIIISTMHPTAFLDSFIDQPNLICESEMAKWNTLLGNFHVLIDPLIHSSADEGIAMENKSIINETRYSRFLHGMQKLSLKHLERELNLCAKNHERVGHVTDSMIFKLQLTSHYFYMDIWQSLTREEKFILFDLAEDGLVNSFDDFNLSLLICKGVIIRDDGILRIFNRSFRNFIITAIGEKEINRIHEQVKDNSKWSDLKTPFSLIITAIIIFLFTSQQDSYSHAITYITALGAAIPAALKILSVFGDNKNNNKAIPKTE